MAEHLISTCQVLRWQTCTTSTTPGNYCNLQHLSLHFWTMSLSWVLFRILGAPANSSAVESNFSAVLFPPDGSYLTRACGRYSHFSSSCEGYALWWLHLEWAIIANYATISKKKIPRGGQKEQFCHFQYSFLFKKKMLLIWKLMSLPVHLIRWGSHRCPRPEHEKSESPCRVEVARVFSKIRVMRPVVHEAADALKR